jgi:hypothetical protein
LNGGSQKKSFLLTTHKTRKMSKTVDKLQASPDTTVDEWMSRECLAKGLCVNGTEIEVLDFGNVENTVAFDQLASAGLPKFIPDQALVRVRLNSEVTLFGLVTLEQGEVYYRTVCNLHEVNMLVMEETELDSPRDSIQQCLRKLSMEAHHVTLYPFDQLWFQCHLAARLKTTFTKMWAKLISRVADVATNRKARDMVNEIKQGLSPATRRSKRNSPSPLKRNTNQQEDCVPSSPEPKPLKIQRMSSLDLAKKERKERAMQLETALEIETTNIVEELVQLYGHIDSNDKENHEQNHHHHPVELPPMVMFTPMAIQTPTVDFLYDPDASSTSGDDNDDDNNNNQTNKGDDYYNQILHDESPFTQLSIADDTVLLPFMERKIAAFFDDHYMINHEIEV